MQNAAGTWVAKDQETYDLYVASIAEAAAPVLPKGFDESAMNRGGMLEVDAAQQRKAYVERPAQLPKPEVAIPLKLQVQPGTAAGKRRGQLSALLADAHSNRAEMEERIALGRANRKAAGNKYGQSLVVDIHAVLTSSQASRFRWCCNHFMLPHPASLPLLLPPLPRPALAADAAPRPCA